MLYKLTNGTQTLVTGTRKQCEAHWMVGSAGMRIEPIEELKAQADECADVRTVLAKR